MLTDFAGVGKMKRMDATTTMQNLNFIDAEAATRELLREKGSEGCLVGFTVLIWTGFPPSVSVTRNRFC